MNILSLFSNIGVAEAYLNKINCNVVLANELDEKRAAIYSKIYPKTEMICGDINTESVQTEIILKAINKKVDIIMATPPCQGMSLAGKKEKNDLRNYLICPTIKIIQKIMPKYVFLENVPQQLTTTINENGKEKTILEYIKESLSENYIINYKIINTANYEVPQTRKRAVFLLTRKNTEPVWEFPDECEHQKTLLETIGDIPILDPIISDVTYDLQLKFFPKFEERKREALSISKWHSPPSHVLRHIISMERTEPGKSALDNINEFKPKDKDGKIVRGYNTAYKRQAWDAPAYTITMANGSISSQNNVHPGRYLYSDKYGPVFSDARVLTLYEIMLCMSLPINWNLPSDISENYIRKVIGEGIPPLFVKKVLKKII